MNITNPAKSKGRSLLVLGVLFLLSSCSPARDVSVTATAEPTDPPPTGPAEPVITPSASATATPAPLLPDLGQVIFSEDFDGPGFPFAVSGPNRIDSGVLVLERATEDGSGNGFYGKRAVPPGATTVVLFKALEGTHFNIGYHAGVYGAYSLRRFSYSAASGRWELYHGNQGSPGGDNPPIGKWDSGRPHFDAWNYFQITRFADGELQARLWERGRPESMLRFQGNLGEEWGALDLTFFIDFPAGTLMIDAFQELR